jgi:hypothetical protein
MNSHLRIFWSSFLDGLGGSLSPLRRPGSEIPLFAGSSSDFNEDRPEVKFSNQSRSAAREKNISNARRDQARIKVGLPVTVTNPEGRSPDALRDFTRTFILARLRRHGGDQDRVAHELGMKSDTLQRVIFELGITPEEVRIGWKQGQEGPPKLNPMTRPTE